MLKSAVRYASAPLAAVILCGAAGPAVAQPVPHSLVASPGIYKVLSENDQYRVIEVTWKPGERDQMHSHPASAVYNPMDCTMRAYGPDGRVLGERDVKAGNATVQPPIPAHSMENVGPAVCKVIMFEPK